MMATTHALVGVMIAKALQDPLMASSVIIASHYLLDLIPHWDFGTDWKQRSIRSTGILAILDTVFAFFICFLLFSHDLPLTTIFLCVCLANAPDWLIAPYFLLFSSKEGYHKSRGGRFGVLYGKFLHYEEKYVHTKTTSIHGILTQIGTVVFFYLLLK
jgi:hypothetical protein